MILSSRSGVFQLVMFQSELQLSDNLKFNRDTAWGYPTWQERYDLDRSAASSLSMQTNGNLVLRNGRGKFEWSSHTPGTGHHNYLQVLDSGALVVRTGSGRTVWTTGTTAVLLKARDVLTKGHTMVNRLVAGRFTRLSMQYNGDLVLYRDDHRVWDSNTHTRGSFMTVTTSGRMVIETARRRVIWRTAVEGKRVALEVNTDGYMTLENVAGHCWQAPARPAADCGSS